MSGIAIKVSIRVAHGNDLTKRAIQEHLLDPLATKLSAGDFKPNDKIKVSANGDKLLFQQK